MIAIVLASLNLKLIYLNRSSTKLQNTDELALVVGSIQKQGPFESTAVIGICDPENIVPLISFVVPFFIHNLDPFCIV